MVSRNKVNYFKIKKTRLKASFMVAGARLELATFGL